MRFDLLSIFPQMLKGPLSAGLLGKARVRGDVAVEVHDLRDYSELPRRGVDDAPYGGGAGMVFRLEPALRALEALRQPGCRSAVVCPSPAGEPLDSALARELGEYDQLVVCCDRYEGSDARLSRWATHEVSVGDYVLTGGEVAALVLVEVVAREGAPVVGQRESVEQDSFFAGLLDHRSYTRPPVLAGQGVPETLVSGHHVRVDAWRRRDALRRTLERRPDLLDGAWLPAADRARLDRERGFVGGDGAVRE